MSSVNMNMTKPCKDCPFRTDVTPYLTPARAEEICDAITRQQMTFSCHETTGIKRPNKGEEEHCAGALIMLEKIERPNQWMRWMERLGFYNRHKLDMEAPVYDKPEGMIEAHESFEPVAPPWT